MVNVQFIKQQQAANNPITKVSLPQAIGKGYKEFWNYKGRYRVLKGGRGSKKSCTTALWFIYNMMKYFHKYGVKPNTLVIRRYFNTHRQSTYAQLKWAIAKLGVQHLWNCTVSPLEMIYKPSGQKIMFRGLDDAQSLTSITVEEGHLCWTWWEEAYQITNEEDFNKIDMSIRGEVPAPLFKQHTITFNPWSEKIWLKKRFFDTPSHNVMAITKNFDCNEFLGDDDRAIFEDMRITNPRRFSIEGEGNWGISEGLVYTNWREEEFDYNAMRKATDRYGKQIYRELYGLDFGYTNDPTAFVAMLADEKNHKLYIFDEIYGLQMSNKDIHDAIKYKGFIKSRICADCEDPRTINELFMLGLGRIYAAKKGAGSVIAGIQKLQDYEIIIHPRCSNFLVEISNYIWKKDKMTAKVTNNPEDDFNHLMDAMRYGTEPLNGKAFSF